TFDDEAPDSLEPVAVIGGESPTKSVYDDAPDKKARERFKNLVTEIWWNLRERFRKTHEARNGIDTHPPDEQISIPDDSELIAQLSTRRYDEVGGRKLKAESKDQMAARGVASPDKADSAVYAFADAVKPTSISFDQPAPQIR
ncbi:MAG: hypothetical protein ABEN55_16035, partial [Bradymonadaceae bacterium]